MSNIEDTIYDLPNEEYHRGERFKDFLSSTQIKDYMVSPKFARYKALHPELFEISIEASEKGSLYHDAMESLVNTGKLDKWRNNLLVFEPPINPKTGCPYGRDTQKYQIALIEAKESNPGKTLTSTTDIQLVETMVYELLNNCRDTSKQIRQILKWGKAEVSHFVEYEGCKFKYRPDVETAKKLLTGKHWRLMIFMKKQLTGLLPNFIMVFRQLSISFLNMNVLEYGRSSTGLCNKRQLPMTQYLSVQLTGLSIWKTEL